MPPPILLIGLGKKVLIEGKIIYGMTRPYGKSMLDKVKELILIYTIMLRLQDGNLVMTNLTVQVLAQDIGVMTILVEVFVLQ